jgi:hypothetical protein
METLSSQEVLSLPLTQILVIIQLLEDVQLICTAFFLMMAHFHQKGWKKTKKWLWRIGPRKKRGPSVTIRKKQLPRKSINIELLDGFDL